MNRTILLLVAVIAVLIAAILYRSSTSSPRLNVEPHAAEEIEKAKRR